MDKNENGTNRIFFSVGDQKFLFYTFCCVESLEVSIGLVFWVGIPDLLITGLAKLVFIPLRFVRSLVISTLDRP